MRIKESNNIKDIVPILANVFLEDFVLSEYLHSEYQEFYNASGEALGCLTKYFNCQMSDSEVLSIEKDRDSVRIEVNDLNYCILAEELVREKNLKIEIQNIQFPCTFLFQGIHHYTINEVDKDGTLVEISDYSIAYNSQILFDQLIFLDNQTIEIGFSLWKYIEDTGKNFLLLISADRCDVMETQIELFNKLANGNLSYFKK